MANTLILGVLALGIPGLLAALIGVYVYRDAKRRNMNAVLWTIIAVLAPSLIGFIIYLLVRTNYSNLKCPRCDAPVTESYVVCPKCGAKLRATCPNCSTPVEADWKVCPKCAETLPEYEKQDFVSPVRPKDNSLSKVLVIVFLIPSLLLIFAILSMFAFSTTGSSSFAQMTVEEYKNDMENEQINAWLEDVGDDANTAYVLMYQTEVEEGVRVQYLIYSPKMVKNHSYSFGVNGGLFKPTFKIKLGDVNGSGGNMVALATYTGEEPPNLKVYYGDRKLDCEITEVDFPVELTDGSKYEKYESSISEGLPQGTLTVEQSDVKKVSP
ncbi:MAG: zinc ribbon domain-containing protein [Methanocorpusculum sp.]|nr:zinc ribbon domain-containing protein [Oscillospiraceae bacterium]MBQ3569392.1 zinc ribbon domain-containing protein [Methanocorpusculum sp.]